jgi:hypothetical protein
MTTVFTAHRYLSSFTGGRRHHHTSQVKRSPRTSSQLGRGQIIAFSTSQPHPASLRVCLRHRCFPRSYFIRTSSVDCFRLSSPQHFLRRFLRRNPVRVQSQRFTLLSNTRPSNPSAHINVDNTPKQQHRTGGDDSSMKKLASRKERWEYIGNINRAEFDGLVTASKSTRTAKGAVNLSTSVSRKPPVG